MNKILLDTDIGTNIDDALCLAYLLANPSCDLKGITTVTGKPDVRACIASVLCRYSRRDVPIVPGFKEPLHGEQNQKTVEQAFILGQHHYDGSFEDEDVLSFMRDVICSSPGEITVLTIGPLTNLAALLNADPKIMDQIKQVVMMGGVYLEPLIKTLPRETNISLDPAAAALVFNKGKGKLKVLGLDVTTKLRKDESGFRHGFAPEKNSPLDDLLLHWFSKKDEVVFHDPLAAVVIFQPDVCDFVHGGVNVQTDGAGKGMTIWCPNGEGEHEIAATVDEESFFVHFFEIMNKSNSGKRSSDL